MVNESSEVKSEFSGAQWRVNGLSPGHMASGEDGCDSLVVVVTNSRPVCRGFASPDITEDPLCRESR
ncbi:hypothetical protein TNCV_4427321 [Trichonephila clavipes]|nr:hypothetical protein TNCV_4427321 [Trichonephila clavipes]